MHALTVSAVLALCIACSERVGDGGAQFSYSDAWRPDSAAVIFEQRERYVLSVRDGRLLDVTHLDVDSDRIALADDALRQVVVFSRASDSLTWEGRVIDPALYKRRPASVSLFGRRLAIADGEVTRQVSILDLDSDSIVVVSLPTQSSTTSVSLSKQYLAVTSTLVGSRAGAGAATIVPFDGEPLDACPLPDTFFESDRRRGMISMMRGFGVRLRGDTAFCRVPILPGAQAIALPEGKRVHRAERPSFFRPPVDQPRSMNQQSFNAFAAKWTENADFFPFERGFMAVYTTFDSLLAERIWLVQLCTENDVQKRFSCREGRVPTRPLAARSTDSVFLLEPSPDASAPHTIIRFEAK